MSDGVVAFLGVAFAAIFLVIDRWGFRAIVKIIKA
jgi:hypothetical protein